MHGLHGKARQNGSRMMLTPLDRIAQNPELTAATDRVAAYPGNVTDTLRSISAAPDGLRVCPAVSHRGRHGAVLTEPHRELVVLLTGRRAPFAVAHHQPLGLSSSHGLASPLHATPDRRYLADRRLLPGARHHAAGRRRRGRATGPSDLRTDRRIDMAEEAQSRGMNPGKQGSQITRTHQPEQETASCIQHRKQGHSPA